MKRLICIEGVTKLSLHLVDSLNSQEDKCNIYMFEPDATLCEKVSKGYDMLTFSISIRNEEATTSVEINNMYAFISALENQDSNITNCEYVSEKYHPQYNIAVIEDENLDKILQGICDTYKIKTFVPPRASARAIIRYIFSQQNPIEKLGEYAEILPFTIDPDCPMKGKPLSKIGDDDKFNQIYVKKPDKTIKFCGLEYVLEEGDTLLLAVEKTSVAKFSKKFTPKKSKNNGEQ